MLSLLHIENIAVVEKADIEFGDGLNVLTGETGAGKSIVIDAIGAVLGGRVSRDLVRGGADNAAVTAVFTDANAREWCEENGIEPDEDGLLFLMRRIGADGKSSCRVNGNPVPVGSLRSLGEMLLDIHGQNEGQRLLNEDYHLDYLDSFAKTGGELAIYKKYFDEFKTTMKEISRHNMDEDEKQRRMDSLKYQIEELEQADIRPGEESELTARLDLLKNAGRLTDAVDSAFFAMYGSEDEEGAVGLISEAERETGRAADYSGELSTLAQSLSELRYAAEDIAEQLRNFRHSLEFSPDELDSIEERLAELSRLTKKYGSTEEKMLVYLEKCRKELDDIEFSEHRLQKLEKELEVKRGEAVKAAERLSSQRKSAAKELEKRIISELNQMNMPGVSFAVEFSGKSGELDFDGTGCDEVRFLMSANAGEKIGRISKIASGGELSRIMLALKNVLAENESLDTLIFDEIDTGVSGIAAQRVGEKLASLSAMKQVLCVTHLPQIAVMADNHFSIAKEERGGRTYTTIERLGAEGRTCEIARLLGGENITETVLKNAAEQLEAAERYKVSCASI